MWQLRKAPQHIRYLSRPQLILQHHIFHLGVQPEKHRAIPVSFFEDPPSAEVRQPGVCSRCMEEVENWAIHYPVQGLNQVLWVWCFLDGNRKLLCLGVTACLWLPWMCLAQSARPQTHLTRNGPVVIPTHTVDKTERVQCQEQLHQAKHQKAGMAEMPLVPGHDAKHCHGWGPLARGPTSGKLTTLFRLSISGQQDAVPNDTKCMHQDQK